MIERAKTWLATAGCIVLAAALLYGAYWYTAPAPPEIDLTGAAPAVVEAVEAARAAVRHAPRSAQAWGQLGMVLFANEYAAPAHECFVQTERLDPDNPMWPYLQAVRMLAQDRDAGIAPLLRAIARADRSSAADVPAHLGTPHLTLAEAYLEEDRRREAEILCQQVLAIDADHPRAHLDLGLLALADDDSERCIRHLTRAAASPYTASRASGALAVAYARLGDAASARAFQRRAKELKSERPWPDPYVLKAKEHTVGPRRHEQRAEQLAEMGQPGEFLHALRDLADEAGDGLAHYRLGVALANAGDYQAAQAVLETAVRAAPGLFSARFTLGAVYLRLGEKDTKAGRPTAHEHFRTAETHLRAAIEMRPTYGLAHLSRGQALQGLGRPTEALVEFHTAVECQPELADAQLALGEALAATGQFFDARRRLELAQSLAPNDPRPPAALARLRDMRTKSP
jgi:tetratricopeptide (TPR) repeat protein